MNTKQKSAGLRLYRTVSCDGWSYGTVVLAVIAAMLLVIVFFGPLLYPHPEYGPRAKTQATKVQIESYFATALDAFQSAVGRYPTTTEGLRALVVKPANNPGDWTRPFLPKIPLDPWGNEYQYVCPGTHNVDSYDLCSFGPDGKPGGRDDITNWEEATVQR